MAATLLLLLVLFLAAIHGPEKTSVADGAWCVVRSEASNQALQNAIDYACGSGADCVPIQASGLCYLPNTIQAHASYAFNSYYQRKANAPGSCVFSGSATIAQTDPSYGSCVFPSNPSNAGGTTTGMTPTILGFGSALPPPLMGGGTLGPGNLVGGGVTPGLTPTLGLDDDTNSAASSSSISMWVAIVSFSTFLLLSYHQTRNMALI